MCRKLKIRILLALLVAPLTIGCGRGELSLGMPDMNGVISVDGSLPGAVNLEAASGSENLAPLPGPDGVRPPMIYSGVGG